MKRGIERCTYNRIMTPKQPKRKEEGVENHMRRQEYVFREKERTFWSIRKDKGEAMKKNSMAILPQRGSGLQDARAVFHRLLRTTVWMTQGVSWRVDPIQYVRLKVPIRVGNFLPHFLQTSRYS